MRYLIIIFLFLFTCLYSAPNVDRLINDVIIGEDKEAREKLPRLLDDYPNDGEVLFLKGILETDGSKSIEIYKKIYKYHKNHKKADEAVMRIGEYYYAIGYYVQASE